MHQSPKGKRLIGLFALFFVLLNFPLIQIMDQEGMIWGIPSLYFTLFLLWFLLIALLYLMMEWH
ncbi:MAG: hypothetical protein D6722_17955 [Bacteroidetes bacterium]|nr:MAG: hypothetical protein D6722_17955 [Bacteroidota bacterium]